MSDPAGAATVKRTHAARYLQCPLRSVGGIAIMRQINESDWKLLRQMASVALERFCRDVLEKLQHIAADDTKTYHQRYLAIYELVRRRDKELAQAFNGMRRSTAFEQLAAIYSQRLLRDEEFSRFSPETRSIVELFLGTRSDS